MHMDFETVSTLQYRNRSLTKQVADFKSGEKYIQMAADYKELLRFHHREMKRLEYELSRAHSETVTVRRYWGGVMDDLEKEYREQIRRLEAEIGRLKKQNLELARQRDAAKDKLRERTGQYYAAASELEEERGKNKKLRAQVNRDFENSSLPSSLQRAGRKKIPNSREKTGRRPGGQPGHKGHPRRKHTPDITCEIPAPAEYAESPDYYETGKVIRKQKVCIRLGVEVIEYTAREYRSRKSGARVHAPFPEGFVNEVNYDGTVKALAFLLSNECCVSHGKIRRLLSELTGGRIVISDGMINGLCGEFSAKTGHEKKEIVRKLLSSPVMNADFTNASVNGKGMQVLVLASPSENAALYIGREKKGHAGVIGTPLADYVGTVVHDHDKTFYSYGTDHQECTQHDIRYLTGSIQNEPELTWNGQMLSLFREMLHYRNGLPEGAQPDPQAVSEFEAAYDRILQKAEEEYASEPPNDYYREGYNLFIRLKEYKENELLFLHDTRVPANNSLCERLARVYKRKQKQAVTLRSYENLCCICDGLSVVYLLRSQGENVYQKTAEIYGRKRPPREKAKEETGVMA